MAYRVATAVVTVSNGVREDIAKITVGLQSKLKVVFNAIPPPPDAVLATQQHSAGARIVWVGRMDQPKNPALMLESFALLPPELGATLDFLGDGPDKEPLERRARELGGEGKIFFRGFQSNPYSWMMNSDILVLTSDREGLPTVLIEALYCGLSIVSTDCGSGIHELLEGERYGRIVQVGNAQAVASAIAQSLQDRKNKDKQREGALRFTPDSIAEQFLHLLKKE